MRLLQMREFRNQELRGLFDENSTRTFSDSRFTQCYFENCVLSMTRNVKLRSTVRDVWLVDCEQRGCMIDAAIFDSVVVDGLKTNGVLQTWGAVYRHVVLRGQIGSFMASDAVASGTATEAEQRAFDKANREFYSSIDWALDVSEGEFQECDLRGVPGRLVRHDPETQVLVTREAALRGRWRNIDLSGTYWDTSLELFLETGAPDIVLVAPRRSRRFKRLLDGLNMLRDIGVAQ